MIQPSDSTPYMSARWALLIVVLSVIFGLGSRCDGSRWSNPATGIPSHPASAPPLGYISPRPPPVTDADIPGDDDIRSDSGASDAEPLNTVGDTDIGLFSKTREVMHTGTDLTADSGATDSGATTDAQGITDNPY